MTDTHLDQAVLDALLNALWECGVASGMDMDGDYGLDAMVAGMGPIVFAATMVESVRQLRSDYDEAADELFAAEARA